MLGAVKSLFKSGFTSGKSPDSSSKSAVQADDADTDTSDYSNDDIGATGSTSSDTSDGGKKATGEDTNTSSNSSEEANDKFNRIEDQVSKKKAAGTTAAELVNKFGPDIIDQESETPEESTQQSISVDPGTPATTKQNEKGVDIAPPAPAAAAAIVGPSIGSESAAIGKAQQLLLDKLGWAGVTPVDYDNAANFVQDQAKGNVEGFVKRMQDSPEFLNQVRKEFEPIMAKNHPEMGMSQEKNIASGVNNGVGLNRALAAALLGSVELNFGGMTFDASHPANTPTGRISPDLASNSLTPATAGAANAPKSSGLTTV